MLNAMRYRIMQTEKHTFANILFSVIFFAGWGSILCTIFSIILTYSSQDDLAGGCLDVSRRPHNLMEAVAEVKNPIRKLFDHLWCCPPLPMVLSRGILIQSKHYLFVFCILEWNLNLVLSVCFLEFLATCTGNIYENASYYRFLFICRLQFTRDN